MVVIVFLVDILVLFVEFLYMQVGLVSCMLQYQGVWYVMVVEFGSVVLVVMMEVGLDGLVVISSFYLFDMVGVDLVVVMCVDEDFEVILFILILSEMWFQVFELVCQLGVCSIVVKFFSEEQLVCVLYGVVDYLNLLVGFDVVEVENLCVLIVDDSLVFCYYLCCLFEELGIEYISEVVNGRQVVELLQGIMVDLVIIDYNMLEMDGCELIEYICM